MNDRITVTLMAWIELPARLEAHAEELRHAAALGRELDVLGDLCCQLIYDHGGLVPDWDDPALTNMVRAAHRQLWPPPGPEATS